jgi:four helix bundle protein
MQIGEEIWKLTNTWKGIVSDTMSKRMIVSADAIASNIALGYGLQSPNEKRDKMVMALSSALSLKTWIEKAYQRQLMDAGIYQNLKDINEKLISKLYGYIHFLEQEGGATPLHTY